ncbi:MAG: TRAP transporter small permease [Rhodobiaceae bacterium]|nr:TRAP transporter small permease [Rhodobiaceae bacterium]
MHSIIERIANAIASMMLFLLACITLIDVIGRNFFSSPLAPATELTEVALVVITFLLYPQIAFRNEHITVDLLDFFLPAWFRRIQFVVAGLLGALLFGVLAWRLGIQADRLFKYGEITAVLKIPLYTVYYFMAVMSALSALAFLALSILPPPAHPDHGASDIRGIE